MRVQEGILFNHFECPNSLALTVIVTVDYGLQFATAQPRRLAVVEGNVGTCIYNPGKINFVIVSAVATDNVALDNSVPMVFVHCCGRQHCLQRVILTQA